jgi:hypothetical protein
MIEAHFENRRFSLMAKAEIYQIKVTLKGIRPPIWRRIQVSSNTSLADFHEILQVTMGWLGGHLHMFTAGGESYSSPPFYDPDPSFLEELGAKDGNSVKLNKLVTGEGYQMLYEYDFGDGWEHVVLVEKILPMTPDAKLPVCIKGKRACPPEDVGGIWGYEEFLEAIKDPNHPEHEMYAEWLDYDFDPEAFDKDVVNTMLQGAD